MILSVHYKLQMKGRLCLRPPGPAFAMSHQFQIFSVFVVGCAYWYVHVAYLCHLLCGIRHVVFLRHLLSRMRLVIMCLLVAESLFCNCGLTIPFNVLLRHIPCAIWSLLSSLNWIDRVFYWHPGAHGRLWYYRRRGEYLGCQRHIGKRRCIGKRRNEGNVTKKLYTLIS